VLPKGSAKTKTRTFILAFDVAGRYRFVGRAKGGETYEQGSFELNLRVAR